MLFILSDTRGAGKTRWLQSAIEMLEGRGVDVCGVISPGSWVDADGNLICEELEDTTGISKQAIECELLPTHETFRFATPKEHGWNFDDVAIERVNEHMRALMQSAAGGSLLIIDEIGFLEFDENAGFVDAMKILDRGPNDRFKDAIVVIRPELVPKAFMRFSSRWQITFIAPNDAARQTLESMF